MRGQGRIYRASYTENGTLHQSERWHIEYWVHGRRVREAVHSTKKTKATELLKLRTGQAALGHALPSDTANTTFEDLARLAKQDYEAKGQRVKDVTNALDRLTEAFAGFKATEITTTLINTYRADQLKDGYARATVNRDIATLHRAFKLAKDEGLVASIPAMTKLPGSVTRKGFFERKDFNTLLKHLPKDLHAVFKVAYITGWRVPSELLTRQWEHVDFEHGRLRLEPGEAKSDEAREFPFISELKKVLTAQRRAAKKLNSPWVFFRDDGAPIRSYAKAWGRAVKAAGIGDRIAHDFRRTAVRNLERAGVPRTVAMKMVGHKTESMYRRYGIVDDAMLSEGAKKLDTFLKG